MSRQAFEAWVRTVDKSLSLHKVPDGGYKYPRTKSAWSAWRSATNAALERAAEVCDRAEVFAWEQWKATGNQHTEGVSDGAASLARDIRALKDETE